MIAYLTAVAGLVAAGLVLRIFGLGTGTGVPEALVLSTALLTLPVSTAYLVVVALGSSQGPVPGEAAFGALTATAALYYLGFLLLAAVNATVFTWIVVRVQVRRTARPGPLSDVQPQLSRRVGRVPHVPAAIRTHTVPSSSGWGRRLLWLGILFLWSVLTIVGMTLLVWGLAYTFYFWPTGETLARARTGNFLILAGSVAVAASAEWVRRMHAPLWVPILVVTPAVLVGGLTLMFEHSLIPYLSALVSFPVALAGLIGGLILSRPLRRNS